MTTRRRVFITGGTCLPSTRATAERLGFVTHAQMTAALLRAVEEPAPDFRHLTVPDIRSAAA